MKHRLILLIMFVVSYFAASELYGQEKKNSIEIQVSMAHFEKIDDLKNSEYGSYGAGYKYPFSPGLELIVNRKLLSKFEIGSGISFQTNRFQSGDDFLGVRRFQCKEISIPLIARIYFLKIENSGFFISLGAYNGLQVRVTSQIPQSVGWTELKEFEEITGYSDDRYFTDTYSDFGYSWKLNEKDRISLLSFVNYRLNTTWLNTYQERIHWGIKVSYQFDLQYSKKHLRNGHIN